jgi:hypothetical protein
MFLSPLSQCTSEDAVEYPNTLNNNAIYNATKKAQRQEDSQQGTSGLWLHILRILVTLVWMLPH